jgi:plastocyanin
MNRRAVLAMGGAAVALAACGKPQPKTYTVTLAAMAFGPTPPELHVGDTIEWVNNDIFQHSATARDGAFDVDLPPKARSRTVLTRAGTIEFYCRYHPGMTGRLAVAS